jgi:hypothetical protein
VLLCTIHQLLGTALGQPPRVDLPGTSYVLCVARSCTPSPCCAVL